MSRPQFNNQSPQQLQVAGGQVVNGGLIDFQDNMQRGVSEYATPQHLMASGYGGVAPQQQPYIAQASYGVYPGYPAPPQLSSGIPPGGQGCISGPPAFLQVGGIVYKPVDSAVPVSLAPTTQSPAPAAPSKVSKQASTAKMLTEDDLHRAIDSRVQSKVESYLSSQRKPHHSTTSTTRAVEERSRDPHSSSSYSGNGARSSSHHAPTSSTRTSEGPVTRSSRRVSDDEELAIQRVQQANASMRAPPSSSRGGREDRGLKW